MQNESNLRYSGLVELQNTENYLNNYNNYIVDQCVKKVRKPNSCIDFGAGIGTLSVLLVKNYGISPICVEIDEENIKFLNTRNLQNFRNINAVKGCVDLVFSSNVLEHIKDDDTVLEAISEKLNISGYLYLYLPANMLLWSELDEIVGHYRRYSRSEIKRKLTSAGFEIESIHYADSIGFFASLFIKLVGFDKNNAIGSPTSLKIYDRYILPFSKFFDAIGLKFFFGKNIVAVAKKMTDV